jgi:hypothetical protein
MPGSRRTSIVPSRLAVRILQTTWEPSPAWSQVDVMMLSTISLKGYLAVLPRSSDGPSNEIRAFAKLWRPHDHAAVHRLQSQLCTLQLARLGLRRE